MFGENVDSEIRINALIWRESSLCQLTFSLEKYKMFLVKFLFKSVVCKSFLLELFLITALYKLT